MSRIVVLLVLLFFSTSCFLKKSDDAYDGPRISLSFSEIVTSLDWHTKLTLPGAIAVTNLLCGLVDYDYDGFQAFVVPACAEKWESHQNYSEWIFKIRKDKKWSDGKPLLSEHFYNSFKRLLSSETKSPFASVLYSIKNAKDFNTGKLTDFDQVGITKVDEYTLRFVLTKPYERFPHVLTHFSTYPIRDEHLKMFSTIKKQYDQTPWLGNFKLIHHTKKRISLFNTVDSQAPIKRFDLMTDVKKDKMTKLIKEKKTHVIFNSDDLKIRNLRRFRLPTFEFIYVAFLTKNKPLNNPIMRRVFSHCINKEELTLIEPQTASLGGVIPPGVEGYESNRGARFDPEMAKLVLRNAKYEGEIKKYEYPLYVQSEDLIPLAKNLKDQWKKCLNLDIKLMPQVFDYNPKAQGIVVQKMQGFNLDPLHYLTQFDKHSDTNTSAWKNYEYEQYLKKPSLAKAQHLLVEEEIPVLPLLYYYHSVATRSEVRGLKQNFNRFIDLKSITLERLK